MYRAIVTKAVVGKGRIANSGDVLVNTVNDVGKVLGCWIINHNYVSSYENGKVFAKGKYDVHVWYGGNGDSDTYIHKQTVDYVEEFNLKVKKEEQINENNQYIIKCLKYPTCSALNLNNDGTVCVKVEKELSLDVIGETILRVQTSSSNSDDWLENDELNNINVDYLKGE